MALNTPAAAEVLATQLTQNAVPNGTDSTAGGSQPPITLEKLRLDQRRFVEERDWQQFHTPRNLLLAMTGEVGELAELFQWRGEASPGLPEFTESEKDAVAEEMSDVLLYLIRMADVCGIDLGSAVVGKMIQNAGKYPADKCRGSSAKYTAYTDTSGR